MIKIQIGDRYLTPTEGEQSWATVGGATLLLGLLTGSKTIAVAGALAVAGAGLSMYEEAQTFTDPELMNAYFQTDGQLSATRGPADAAALRGLR